jgi:hypothetical protein
MGLILRHPVNEVQFLKFAASGSTPISAGKLVYLSDDRTVSVISSASAQIPVGFLMQKVKADYTDFPTNYRMRSDLGSSDAFLGDPVGVACGHGAVYETDQYHDVSNDGISAGTRLYVNNSGLLADTDEHSAAMGATAVALNTLTSTETAAGKYLLIKALV